ncbi:hypothetical protein ACWEFJ_37695 [Actinosynnema sp. NPDC004786]
MVGIEVLSTGRTLAHLVGESTPPAAVGISEDLLADHLRVWGRSTHKLTARRNLAFCRVETGDTARAVAELVDVLADHPWDHEPRSREHPAHP